MNTPITCLLPTVMNPQQESFKNLGFTLKNIEDENLCLATLPAGWKSVANDGPWMFLIDEKGRKRVSYAYYKSESCMKLHNSLIIYSKSLSDNCSCPSEVFVKNHATNKILFVAGQFEAGDLEAFERLVISASKYLDEHYPDWKDPTKYWD